MIGDAPQRRPCTINHETFGPKIDSFITTYANTLKSHNFQNICVTLYITSWGRRCLRLCFLSLTIEVE